MCESSWRESLVASLTRLRRPDRPLRVAVVGMGHDLRGDDGAGPAVARALRGVRGTGDGVLVLDAGSAPENHTGPLRRFAPDLVLLVDAAEMGEAPGAVRWLAWEQTSGLSASTHTMPPYVLARFLTAELECEVALLGIQPAATMVGAPFTPAVAAAVTGLARDLNAILMDR